MSLSCSWKGLNLAVNKLYLLAESLRADDTYDALTSNWYVVKSQALIRGRLGLIVLGAIALNCEPSWSAN